MKYQILAERSYKPIRVISEESIIIPLNPKGKKDIDWLIPLINYTCSKPSFI